MRVDVTRALEIEKLC